MFPFLGFLGLNFAGFGHIESLGLELAENITRFAPGNGADYCIVQGDVVAGHVLENIECLACIDAIGDRFT